MSKYRVVNVWINERIEVVQRTIGDEDARQFGDTLVLSVSSATGRIFWQPENDREGHIFVIII